MVRCQVDANHSLCKYFKNFNLFNFFIWPFRASNLIYSIKFSKGGYNARQSISLSKTVHSQCTFISWLPNLELKKVRSCHLVDNHLFKENKYYTAISTTKKWMQRTNKTISNNSIYTSVYSRKSPRNLMSRNLVK